MTYQNKSVVDFVEVQRMIGTDQDLFRILVAAFSEEASGQLSAIDESIIRTDPVSLGNSAHSFKSSLATLGAFTASDLAGQLEIMGKTDSMNEASKVFAMLKLEYEKVASYFKSSQWIKDWELIN